MRESDDKSLQGASMEHIVISSVLFLCTVGVFVWKAQHRAEHAAKARKSH